ncbi:MAG: DNA/RNA non-specific endonuclease [Candidatus Bruticola sp.]
MCIGSISGSSLYASKQVADNFACCSEKSEVASQDTFVKGNNAQFVKEQNFAKAGRFFQSCISHHTDSASEAIAIQGDKVSMFEGRNGYDKNFLGTELPLPELGSSIKDQVAMRTDKPGECELTYTNYSVVMNKDRKQCFYAICNIDGNNLHNIKRAGNWTLDGRIPREYQLGDEAYKRNNIDKGHMVRRLDPCWGKNAELASRDTFSYCNASLQHAGLNQDEWLALEDHVLASAKGQKMSVITGPIFSESDPWFDNNGKMEEPAQIPMKFFKTVVWADEKSGALKSASFILSQEDIIKEDDTITTKGGFDPDRFGVYQVPQKEVERLTDLHFGNIGDITEQPMRLTAANNYAPLGLER